MNTRILVTISLLVGIGTVLNGVVPPIFTMKPDLTLLMMFLSIILFPNRKYVLLTGLSTGFITALTTTFPSGQIPNIIDKPLTAFIFFGLLLLVQGFNMKLVVGILTFVGTVVSGFIFLTSTLLLFGLPGGLGYTLLLVSVVLPAALINTILMLILYPILLKIQKQSNLSTTKNLTVPPQKPTN